VGETVEVRVTTLTSLLKLEARASPRPVGDHVRVERPDTRHHVLRCTHASVDTFTQRGAYSLSTSGYECGVWRSAFSGSRRHVLWADRTPSRPHKSACQELETAAHAVVIAIVGKLNSRLGHVVAKHRFRNGRSALGISLAVTARLSVGLQRIPFHRCLVRVPLGTNAHQWTSSRFQ
jgi:hypothetical protein